MQTLLPPESKTITVENKSFQAAKCERCGAKMYPLSLILFPGNGAEGKGEGIARSNRVQYVHSKNAPSIRTGFAAPCSCVRPGIAVPSGFSRMSCLSGPAPMRAMTREVLPELQN